MADDEDDKIRRNLVAASFLTIVSAWFDIPLLKLAVGALGSEIGVISEWRLWVAGLAVFSYLLIRYRFSKEGSAYVYAVLDEAKKQLFFKVGNFVEQKAQRFTQTGIEHAIFAGVLSRELSASKDQLIRDHPQVADSAKTRVSIAVQERRQEVWDMELRINISHKLSTGLTVQKEIQGVSLRQPSVLVSRTIMAWAWLHTLTFSEASVRNVFPVWMATVAVSIFVWRISQGYILLWVGV